MSVCLSASPPVYVSIVYSVSLTSATSSVPTPSLSSQFAPLLCSSYSFCTHPSLKPLLLLYSISFFISYFSRASASSIFTFSTSSSVASVFNLSRHPSSFSPFPSCPSVFCFPFLLQYIIFAATLRSFHISLCLPFLLIYFPLSSFFHCYSHCPLLKIVFPLHPLSPFLRRSVNPPATWSNIRLSDDVEALNSLFVVNASESCGPDVHCDP